MGQKCHPIALRLGIIKDWQSRWYAPSRLYHGQVIEDFKIRDYITRRFARDASANTGRGRGGIREVGLSHIEIERAANTLRITLHTAKPGLIIGRGGRGVDELKSELEGLTERRVQITVQEVRDPSLDAQLVGEAIASQMERRVAFKRAVRQALQRTMREGAKGIRVIVSGRLAGAEIARTYRDHEGKLPLQTLRADIDYGYAVSRTTYGAIGVRVWIYRGDVLPEALPKVPRPEQIKITPPVERKGWRRVGVVSRPESEAAEAPESEVAPAPEEGIASLASLPEAAAAVLENPPAGENTEKETESN
jgi:small subunit ribosomal protein S3